MLSSFPRRRESIVNSKKLMFEKQLPKFKGRFTS
ncbi:pilS cassette [Neisseria mucosa]|uniref:PilS cassette n=1 Tax=Neisseria mucosa TaxID=488 RepID=A0ABN5IG05_NEIMU|nr:pilS cassette [Neisseria mucosa]AVR80241.1 pilS cassette [Neisseria mucosa]